MLSLTDLVYNHTANESPWIKTHPECVFNLVNSPHLKPAFLLDRILWHLTIDVGEGRLEDKGLPPQIKTEDHLNVNGLFHLGITELKSRCWNLGVKHGQDAKILLKTFSHLLVFSCVVKDFLENIHT